MNPHEIVSTSMEAIWLFGFVMWTLGAAFGVILMLPLVRRRGR